MEKRIPKKTYRNIMNSLGGGTVPREGLGYIAVGREKEIDSLLRDTEIIQEGGATFRFVVGDYGSGKTFLLQTIKEYCVKNNFIVAEADLSPDRALIGNSAKKNTVTTIGYGVQPFIRKSIFFAFNFHHFFCGSCHNSEPGIAHIVQKRVKLAALC